MSLGGARQTQPTNQGTAVGGEELVIQTINNHKARPRVGIRITLNKCDKPAQPSKYPSFPLNYLRKSYARFMTFFV